MDLTAISLAKDTNIPIFVTNIFKKNSLINVLNRKGSYSKISQYMNDIESKMNSAILHFEKELNTFQYKF